MAREADRDHLLALLREHYACGHLDEAELDRRVAVILSAKYVDEMAAVVIDLPTIGTTGAAAPPGVKRRRGHAQAAAPEAGWIPTEERFRDPTTRTVMRVWIDPADNSRHYVPEAEP